MRTMITEPTRTEESRPPGQTLYRDTGGHRPPRKPIAARAIRTAVLCSLAVLLTAGVLSAQYNSFNQRDDKYRLLGLKRAKEYFEVVRKEYDRQKDLFEKGLISETELDRAKNTYADAEVNYQQSLLSVLFEQQYVSVDRAVKYQAQDGSKHVRLTVANASGSSEEYRKLLGLDDQLFRSLQPDLIQNIYVSLYNDDGAIISQPYEAKVEELRSGDPRQVDFALLQDLDALTVNIIYGNGSSRTLKIFLQKDYTANRVLVQSQQFSQEAELGKSATYGLTLELFSGVNNTFSLAVVNLPGQINRYFRDETNGARLSQIRFTESVNTMKAALEVSLPDRPTERVPMDTAMSFFVLAIPSNRTAEIQTSGDKTWTEAEIRKLNIGYVKLELIPRGKGRLLVRAPQLYHTIGPGGTVEMSVDLVNEGTRRLDNVKVDVDVPLNWTKTVEPGIISTLGINQEQRVTIRAVPAPGTGVGRYEMRLRTSGLSDNQPVNAEDKTVTVEVQEETSIFWTILLILFILGLVGAVVVFGIRLSKK